MTYTLCPYCGKKLYLSDFDEWNEQVCPNCQLTVYYYDTDEEYNDDEDDDE